MGVPVQGRGITVHGLPQTSGVVPGATYLRDILKLCGDEQTKTWAEQAEVEYDIDELKRRGRGRPGGGAEPMQVVAVRLTAEELYALDEAAARSDMSRSEAIRAALTHLTA